MSIIGAGLATAIDSALSFAIMLTHFFTKRHILHFVKPNGFLKKLKDIFATGVSNFFDVAVDILTVLFNRQILKYLGTNALAVYGIIVNISSFV